jgi:hypothetical protein
MDITPDRPSGSKLQTSAASTKEQTLVDKIINWLKNRRSTALIIVLAIGIVAIAHLMDALLVIEKHLKEIPIIAFMFQHNPTVFEYPGNPGGRYVKEGDLWRQYSNASPSPIFIHKEFKRDKDFIYLIDTSRVRNEDHASGTYTRLPIQGGQAEWSYPNPIQWVPFVVVTPNK